MLQNIYFTSKYFADILIDAKSIVSSFLAVKVIVSCMPLVHPPPLKNVFFIRSKTNVASTNFQTEGLHSK